MLNSTRWPNRLRRAACLTGADPRLSAEACQPGLRDLNCAHWGILFAVLAAETRLSEALRTTSAPAASAASQPGDFELLTASPIADRRIAAASRILQRGSAADLERLRRLLGGEGNTEAAAAICAAARSGPALPPVVFDALLKLLGASDPTLADAARQAIARDNPQRCVPALRRLATDPAQSIPTRNAAVATLACVSTSYDAVAALASLLADPVADVQESALQALEKLLGQPLGGIAAAREWWRREQQRDLPGRAAAWRASRDRQQLELEERLAAVTQRLVRRIRAEYLQLAEPQKAARLATLLRDDEPAVRQLALELTNALITDRQAVPPEVAALVRERLADPSAVLRRAAAAILGDLRDAGDAPRLIEALKQETYESVRAAMMRSLARIGDADLLPWLTTALDDASPIVATEAAAGLGVLVQRSGVEVAQRAAIAERLHARLMKSAPMTESFVSAALEALRLVGDARSRPVLLMFMQPAQSIAVRTAAIRTAGALPECGLHGQINELVSDENPAIRQAVVRELGRFGRSEDAAARLFARALPETETVEAVRGEATAALSSVLVCLPANLRTQWAERLAARHADIGSARTVELLTGLSDSLDAPATSGEWREVRRLLGDIQLALGRHAAAVETYAGIWTPAAGEALSSRLLRAAVLAGDADRAVAAIAATAAPASAAAATGPMQDLFAALRSMVESGRAGDAGEMAEALLSRSAAQLSDAERGLLQQVVVQAGERLDRLSDRPTSELIAMVAEAATGAGDARRVLAQRGTAALPELIDALERRLEPRHERGADEAARLAACVRAVAPDWPGWADGADLAARRAAIGLLRRHAGSPASSSAGVASSAATASSRPTS